MSCIASAVSCRIASGVDLEERPAAGLERRHALGRHQPVRRVVRADRQQVGVAELGTAARLGRGGSGTHGCTIVVLRRREIVDRRPCHTASVTTAPRKGTRVRPAPTLEEVAAGAGVSRATASRVLRGDAKVSEQAREAVLAAAQEISYVPNLAARTLVTGRSDSVAFLVEETEERMFADPFFLGMLRSAQEAVAVAGLQLVFTVVTRAEDQAAFLGLRRRRPRRRGVAALAARSGPAAAAARGARRTHRPQRAAPQRAASSAGTSTRTTSGAAGSRRASARVRAASTSRR